MGASVEAKPPALHSPSAHSECNELEQILFAALGEYALPTDKISFDKPDPPLVPEGPPGESRLVPIRRNTAGVWHNGWKGHSPGKALVRRWAETPVSSVGSCTHMRPGGDLSFARVFSNWGSNASASQQNRSYSWTFRVSKPILDKTGTHALIFYEMYRAGLGGGTGLIYVERTGSIWRKVGERLLSNS